MGSVHEVNVNNNLTTYKKGNWNLETGRRYEVFVTHVHSCTELYMLSSRDYLRLQCVMHRVEVHCAESQCLSTVPVGSACCALSPDDGKWHRALVLEYREHDNVLVSYVDYGNKQLVSRSNLRPITAELMQTPVMVKKCTYQLGPNADPSSQLYIILKRFILHKTLQAYIISQINEIPLISLFDHNVTPEINVASAIIEQLQNEVPQASTSNGIIVSQQTDSIPSGSSCIYISSDDEDSSATEEYEDDSIQLENTTDENTNHSNDDANTTTNSHDDLISVRSFANTNNIRQRLVPINHPYLHNDINFQTEYDVSVVWFTTPFSFYVRNTALEKLFSKQMNNILKLYKDTLPYRGKVTKGASVMVKSPKDGIFYRATVLSCRPYGMYLVQYIDYGKKTIVQFKNIWQVDEKLMKLPRMAIHCSLVGVLPLNEEWKSEPSLKEFFRAPRYRCVFHDFDGEKHLVSMWNNGVSVADIINQSKFAIRTDQLSTVTSIEELTDLNILVGQYIHCAVTQVFLYNVFYLRFIAFDGTYSQHIRTRFSNHTPPSIAMMMYNRLNQVLTGNKFIAYVSGLIENILVVTLYTINGDKINDLWPDYGVFSQIFPLCRRSVFSANYGKAYISHINNSSSLYLHRASDGDALANLLDNMLQFYEEGTTEALEAYKVQTLCALKTSDNIWYRGIIKNVAATECRVHLLDYGKTALVSKEAIKKLDHKFYQPCAFALEVGLKLDAFYNDALYKLVEWTTDNGMQVFLTRHHNGWLANLQVNEEDICLKLRNEYSSINQVRM